VEDKGYWVECVPLRRSANQNLAPDLYSASVSSFPDIQAYGRTPDAAIEKLRSKLKLLKQRYEGEHKALPRPHPSLSPTARYQSVEGWMSVYVDLEELKREQRH